MDDKCIVCHQHQSSQLKEFMGRKIDQDEGSLHLFCLQPIPTCSISCSSAIINFYIEHIYCCLNQYCTYGSSQAVIDFLKKSSDNAGYLLMVLQLMNNKASNIQMGSSNSFAACRLILKIFSVLEERDIQVLLPCAEMDGQQKRAAATRPTPDMHSILNIIFSIWRKLHTSITNKTSWTIPKTNDGPPEVLFYKIWKKILLIIRRTNHYVTWQPKLLSVIESCCELVEKLATLHPMTWYKAMKVLQICGEGFSDIQLRNISLEMTNRFLQNAGKLLQLIKKEEKKGFLGSATVTQIGYDEDDKCVGRCYRQAVLLIIKFTLFHLQESASSEGNADLQILQRFYSVVQSVLQNHQYNPEWICLFFGEQDDQFISVLLSLLDLHVILKQQRFLSCSDEDSICSSQLKFALNPHINFLLFGKSISWDSSVMLDFLISNETEFLEYLVKYLKLFLNEWPEAKTACEKLQSDEFHCNLEEKKKFKQETLLKCQNLVSYASSSDDDDLDENQKEEELLQVDVPIGADGYSAAGLLVSCLQSLKELKFSLLKSASSKLCPFNCDALIKLLSKVENKIL